MGVKVSHRLVKWKVSSQPPNIPFTLHPFCKRQSTEKERETERVNYDISPESMHKNGEINHRLRLRSERKLSESKASYLN